MTEINKENLAALLKQFDEADASWEEKKKQVDAEYSKRSDIVKAIALVIAPSKKLRYKGQDLTIVCRSSKKGSEGESWFFKGTKQDEDIVEIG